MRACTHAYTQTQNTVAVTQYHFKIITNKKNSLLHHPYFHLFQFFTLSGPTNFSAVIIHKNQTGIIFPINCTHKNTKKLSQ